MGWIVVGVVIIAVFGFFEWRSRNKPLAPGFDNAHEASQNIERPSTGGTGISFRPPPGKP